MALSIKQIEEKDLTWVNVTHVGTDEMKYLEDNFHFHPLHLADCLSPLQRPKIDITPDYIFMVLLFPIYNKRTREIIASEVDFFISTNLVVTVHRNELTPLINFYNICEISKSMRKKYFIGNPAILLHEILHRLFIHIDPILEQLNIGVKSIEDNMFRGYERQMVGEILVVKRNILNFIQIMQSHRNVLQKLIERSGRFFSLGILKPYFAEIIEQAETIWEELINLQKSIGSLETTNNSLISFKINDVIKTLTIISVIFLPATLIASLFALSIKGIPFAENPYGFWMVIAIIIFISLIFIYYLKRKKWM